MKFKWIEHFYVIVIHILLKTRKILAGSRWRSSLWRWHGDLGWHLSSEPSWKRWSWISSSCEPSITILWNTLEPCTKRHNFRKSKVTFFCEVLNDACWDTYMGFIIPSPKSLNAVGPVGCSVDFTSQGLDYHPYLFAPRKWPSIFGEDLLGNFYFVCKSTEDHLLSWQWRNLWRVHWLGPFVRGLPL